MFYFYKRTSLTKENNVCGILSTQYDLMQQKTNEGK